MNNCYICRINVSKEEAYDCDLCNLLTNNKLFCCSCMRTIEMKTYMNSEHLCICRRHYESLVTSVIINKTETIITPKFLN